MIINIDNIEQYRENNRIEAKKALGGLPHSIWETYSSFANTLGGIILLGVEEHRDKSFHTVDLTNPDQLIDEFWQKLSDPKKASVNILSKNNISIHVIDGHHIIAITVPRAQRHERPVYIDGNPYEGTYRRCGEGDYRCSHAQVDAMLRDAAAYSPDMQPVASAELADFDEKTLRRYRSRLRKRKPGPLAEISDNPRFLQEIGAADFSKDGRLHPTVAGVLMFGKKDAILKFNPHFQLIYREQKDNTSQAIHESFEGNIYEFYFRCSDRLCRDLPISKNGSASVQQAMFRSAVREALTNCLINADYQSRDSIIVSRFPERIEFRNPGSFRVSPSHAINGGISDPRNAALMKLFNLVDIAKRSGSGISNLYASSRSFSLPEPQISEQFNPERVILTLFLGSNRTPDRKTRSRSQKNRIHNQMRKEAILSYLTEHISASEAALRKALSLSPEELHPLLHSLTTSEILVPYEEKGETVYRLKA